MIGMFCDGELLGMRPFHCMGTDRDANGPDNRDLGDLDF